MAQLTGLLGYPVHHSVSPQMQNAAFNEQGLSFEYEKFNVPPEQLQQAVEALKTFHYKGCNVTIPHKTAVMPFLDEISEEARRIGAVNTIVNENGVLVGYNTDGAGFVKGVERLMNRRISSQDTILVIGAGGASRAICYALANKNPKVVAIANRTEAKATQIANDCLRESDVVLSLQQAEEQLASFGIVINTTSMGMNEDDPLPLSLTHLNEGTYVIDIIYNPFQTKWLTLAKEKGAIIDNGVAMLVFQGALAFTKWTGKEPNVSLMEQIVVKSVGGNYVIR
ncbi:shikimate 5-dehydrogenase [Fictibacillus macauensis ZFHKF-1]|uniref:Shikimate dehydrogenase (NADP(+)) n=1 Tax=Fictibacillus macauensis ZFHKF-1 TaxID=1196324 RepID=I8AHP1_9BACL|nr:shikimate dehydrogenase [Fictibacillus macauensis]EIT85247.1 shikimate 5-dehydrogenase [Fictibacillus macauensis ZFHKF-1]